MGGHIALLGCLNSAFSGAHFALSMHGAQSFVCLLSIFEWNNFGDAELTDRRPI